jgi:hypothetical protein
VPSSSLRNRLKALETAQVVANDDVYWAAVLEHHGPFMREFERAISGEISLEEWEAWQIANPHPERGRPPTAEEERQAAQAWADFWQKIRETRERLLNSGLILERFNNSTAVKVPRHATDHDKTDPGHETLERPGEPAEHPSEHPEHGAPAPDPAGSQPAPRRRDRDSDSLDPDEIQCFR